MQELATPTPIAPPPPWALAAASYLARYSGNTLRSYTVSLRLLFTWCTDHGLDPLAAKRVHLELFVRYLEQERGCIPSSVAHHLTPVFGYYRFATIDGYLVADPTAMLRRPRVFADTTRQLALDRDELRALLAAARASTASELALVAMMALLGLRVSETLLAAVGSRTHGPILVRPERGPVPERPWTRRAAALAITRLCRAAGIDKPISPHSLRHTFVTLGLDAGIPLRDMQVAARHSDPRITARYDRGRLDYDTHPNHRIAADLLEVADDANRFSHP